MKLADIFSNIQKSLLGRRRALRQSKGFLHVPRLRVNWVLLICMMPGLLSAATIKHARLWSAPDSTQLVLDVSGEVSHQLLSLSKPDRIVIDVMDVKCNVDFSRLNIKDTPIVRVRSAVRNGHDVRVVLDLRKPLKPRSNLLKPNEQYGHRLVIDLIDEAADTSAKVTHSVDEHTDKRNIVVVVDAGHGGEDPGALGPGRVREKDVVFAITKELQALLQQQRGFDVKLTRTGDYYVDLRQRTRLARKYNADLFVSVHADAFKRPDAEGASVWVLSDRGADSEMGRWLSRRENGADLIGGAGSVTLNDKDDVLAGVLLDLSMTASLKASLGVGEHVLKSVGKVAQLHKGRVEHAGFVVLKSPDIPSLLVETGFISNPSESRLLKTKKYQQRIAEAVQDGIQEYFKRTPPPGSLLAWDQQQRLLASAENTVSRYEVRRGDTLSQIARNHDVSVDELMTYNRLNSSQVRIGQVIRIPST